jgi:hypothetical protein
MKKKIVKILGAGVTVALLTSLLVAASPVRALSQPIVNFVIPNADDVINKVDADYVITFNLGKDLEQDDTITIALAYQTVITPDSLTATISASSGWIGGVLKSATVAGVTWDANETLGTITATLGASDEIGDTATVQIGITGGITNPSNPGSYFLTVATTDEPTAVKSAAYKIVAPKILPVPGVVSVYNSQGVLMGQTYSIAAAITDHVGSNTGYKMILAPGTYSETFNVTASGLTIAGTEGLADSIIIKPTAVVDIRADKVTIDGVTIDCTTAGLTAGTGAAASSFVIKNSTFKNGIVQLKVVATGATTPGTIDNCIFDVKSNVTKGITVSSVITVKNSKFNVDTGGVAIEASNTDVAVSGCTFTGASGTGYITTGGTSTINKCTFKTLTSAISVSGATVTVSGSTIESCAASTAGGGDVIEVTNSSIVTMYNNTITKSASANYALDIAEGSIVKAWFNNITSNTKNISGAVDARYNWWGTAKGPTSGSITPALVTTSPVLGASVSDAAVAFSTSSLDTSTTVGLSVTGLAGSIPEVLDCIAVARYSDNPQVVAAPLYGTGKVLGYYDVFYIDTAPGADTLQIKFYGAVSSYTKLYYGGALGSAWTELTNFNVNVTGGYVYVTITGNSSPNIVGLKGTPFVLVDDKTTSPPKIGTPEIGANDISITPTFSWDPVDEAIRYEITLSRDPNFTIIDWSYNVTNPLYNDLDSLKYSTTYYWRVRGILAEPYLEGSAWKTPSTPWSVGVFTTEAELVMEEPQGTVESPGGVTVEIPPTKITVEQPGPVVPDYILWIVIAVCAVLVITPIVLIIRSRR